MCTKGLYVHVTVSIYPCMCPVGLYVLVTVSIYPCMYHLVLYVLGTESIYPCMCPIGLYVHVTVSIYPCICPIGLYVHVTESIYPCMCPMGLYVLGTVSISPVCALQVQSICACYRKYLPLYVPNRSICACYSKYLPLYVPYRFVYVHVTVSIYPCMCPIGECVNVNYIRLMHLTTICLSLSLILYMQKGVGGMTPIPFNLYIRLISNLKKHPFAQVPCLCSIKIKFGRKE